MDYSSKSGLAFDDGIGDAHLAAESGKENNKFNRINVVRDEDEGSLLVLDQADNVVETILDGIWLLADVLFLLASLDSSGLLEQTLLLLSLGFWTVLVEEF